MSWQEIIEDGIRRYTLRDTDRFYTVSLSPRGYIEEIKIDSDKDGCRIYRFDKFSHLIQVQTSSSSTFSPIPNKLRLPPRHCDALHSLPKVICPFNIENCIHALEAET